MRYLIAYIVSVFVISILIGLTFGCEERGQNPTLIQNEFQIEKQTGWNASCGTAIQIAQLLNELDYLQTASTAKIVHDRVSAQFCIFYYWYPRVR